MGVVEIPEIDWHDIAEKALRRGAPMRLYENKITVEHEGRSYSANYTVDRGIVRVTMQDRDGSRRGTSTFIDGSPAELVARSLLGELLKAIAFL